MVRAQVAGVGKAKLLGSGHRFDGEPLLDKAQAG
ncbi:hypothetical protein M2397_003555 [Pseudomonas sp. BIGb0381]|nr:hypothetical protein [Pseudomonas sp. SJZ073]MBB6311753.1 hypothetical protein [Pseudomonas sp. JAI120]MCS4313247.1 hypothetical protein [Pseudomonas sp. BIGb0381]